MTRAERIKALQARLARLQLTKAADVKPQPGVQVLPLGGPQMQSGFGLPPIRIDLTVKAQNDPNEEQRMVGRINPAPG